MIWRGGLQLLLLSHFVYIVVTSESERTYIRGCYTSGWARHRPDPWSFGPSKYRKGLCTHLFYAFGIVTKDFMAGAEEEVEVLPERGVYAQYNGLKSKDPQLRTLLSFQGSEKRLSALIESAETSQKFARSAVEFAKSHGFDGVDIDWEDSTAPPMEGERENFTRLMTDLREAAQGDKNFLLTVALPAAPSRLDAFDGKELAKVVDFFNVQAYNYHGSWETKTGFHSALFSDDQGDASTSLSEFNARGIPKEQLILGIPLYGRGWKLSNPKEAFAGAPASGPSDPLILKEPSAATYFELCGMLDKDAVKSYDDKAKSAYLSRGDEWFSFDDKQSVLAKIEYVKKNSFGGVFVWELEYDDFLANCTSSDRLLFPIMTSRRRVKRQEQLYVDYRANAELLRARFEKACGECSIEPSSLGKRVELLGEGHYGKVYRRSLTLDNGRIIDAACKEIQPKHINNCADLLDEAKLMTDLKHRHVLQFVGYTYEGHMPIIITEFMCNGSLKDYLMNKKPPIFRLTHFCKEAASGMQYLHSNHIIHRDLAARNCMLDGDLSLRISDFGLSRRFESYEDGYIQKQSRQLPIPWMPLEVIQGGRFTTMGDIWSYGVLVWECFSYGATPYREEFKGSSPTSNQLIAFLRSGKRLKRPEICTRDLYETIAVPCWNIEPKKRPNFSDIYSFLHNELTACGARVQPSVKARITLAKFDTSPSDTEESCSVGYTEMIPPPTYMNIDPIKEHNNLTVESSTHNGSTSQKAIPNNYYLEPDRAVEKTTTV